MKISFTNKNEFSFKKIHLSAAELETGKNTFREIVTNPLKKNK